MLYFKHLYLLPLAVLLFGASLILGPVSKPASAQDSEVTTKSVKDWIVRCVERGNLPPCDAVQSISSNQTGERVMLTSIAYLGESTQIGVQIWVQTGVLVSAGVIVEVDEKETVLKDLQFTRCEAEGCFIEAIVTEDALTPLKKGSNAAVAILASTGQPRVIGLSLSGFTQALSEVKEANTAWFEAQ